ncbi:MAG: thioredoxin family protein [Planctomycetia bacterium]|nr:thioredoxin family protein [Planctomycetia bacterium]
MKHATVWACAALIGSLLAGCEVGVEGPPGVTAGSAPAPAAPQPPARGSRLARGNLRFVEGYRQGYEQGVSQGKPMLLFFTAEWCHFCHQMADEAFTHPQVVSLSEHFICILIDVDAEPDVCREFQVSRFPTIQFVSPRGIALERIVGKKPGHQLMMAMQAALQSVARRAEANDEAEVR